METSDSKYLFNIGDPIDDNGFEVADEDVLTIWVKGRESPLSPHFYEAKLTADELRDILAAAGKLPVSTQLAAYRARLTGAEA